MSKKKSKKVSKFYYYEAMDRCHVVMSLMDDILIDHIGLSKDQNKTVMKAQALIMDVYQAAGSKFFDMEEAK